MKGQKRIKKYIGRILALAVVCATLAVTEVPQAQSKARKTAMSISTAAELQFFLNRLNAGEKFVRKQVILLNDITMDHLVVNNILPAPDRFFRGTFDGRGHAIRGINITGAAHACLFSLGKGGTVKNLKITDSDITGAESASGLVGTNVGTIDHCQVYFCNINSGKSSAGLAVVNKGRIFNSGAIHNKIATAESVAYSEGSAGITMINFGTVKNCFNTSELSVRGGTSTGGGIAGLMEYKKGGHIAYCYSIGRVDCVDRKGGIIGFLQDGTLSHCFSSFESAPDLFGDRSVGTSDNCALRPAVDLQKATFCDEMNAYVASDPLLDRWVINTEYGCIAPYFPGTFSKVKAFAPKKLRAKSKKKKTLTVIWKSGGTDTCEVELSYNKKFKHKTVLRSATGSCVFTGLKRKKRVFVRARSYVQLETKRVCSAYTAVKRVRVK